MKKNVLINPAILLLAIIFAIVSCSKQGPTGPAGVAGPAGPQGTTGTTGAPGPAGTANVIYSPWLNVSFHQDTTNVSDTNWYAGINAPKLTDSILNMGEIKVYFNAGSDSTGGQFVLPLPTHEPFLFTNNSKPITLIINSYFVSKAIYIIANHDISSYNFNRYNYFQFRYILIPGGVSTGRMAGINWKDYNSVKMYLGLKD